MKILTLARDLQRRKARERQGLFVVEGVRGVEELLRTSFAIKGVLSSKHLLATPRGAALAALIAERGLPAESVDDKDFASAADTDTPQGILAIGVVPQSGLEDLPDAPTLTLLILDGVQDPGNAGTILRTAAALGATATLALPGTVDLWNSKVVRSGMGAHFHHPCLVGTWDELAEFRERRGLQLWAADVSGQAIRSAAPPARLGLIVGNEGSGLSSQARTRADRLVALPIASTVESLNVAVAAGILLYELNR
jgi:RNA methyltransferase, TrmH family